jgi:hypothetical protein
MSSSLWKERSGRPSIGCPRTTLELFAIVPALLPVIPSEGFDVARFTRFLRRERPGQPPLAPQHLEWAEEYLALTRLTILRLPHARVEPARRLKESRDTTPGAFERPTVGSPRLLAAIQTGSA